MIERLPALGRWIRYLVFGMLLAVPVSAAAVNIFGGLALVLALVSREFWTALPRLLRNRVVQMTLVMLALLILGTLYTSGPTAEAWTVVRRYRKLLYIPLLLPFFMQSIHRRQAIHAFAASVMVTVLLSFSEWFDWTHVGADQIWNTPPGDSVFGSHITQGYMIALLIAFAAALALSARRPVERLLWIGIATLGTLDIAVVMIGRTAKLILPILLVWALWEGLRRAALPRRTVQAILVASVTCVIAALVLVALDPQTRLGTVLTEIRTSISTGERTSQGERVEFYRKSLELFEARPLTGFGTGSLKTETEKMATGASTDIGRMTTRNPHNEFIMWAVQLGLPGLLALIAFAILILRGAGKPRTPDGAAADAGDANDANDASDASDAMMLRGAWVVFFTGCLMNSLLLDHLEGHAFVLLVGVLLPL